MFDKNVDQIILHFELTEDERYKIEQRRLQNRQSAQRSRKRSENNEQNLLQVLIVLDFRYTCSVYSIDYL